MSALNLLYTCNNNGIYLYVEEEKLKYKQLKMIDDNTKSQLLQAIKNHKNELIEILVANNRMSASNADLLENTLIYRSISKTTSPLSYAQERLWFIENYEHGSNAYNIPMIHKLSPCINLEFLEKALQAVVSRHEILHSIIKTDHRGHGYQEVIDLNILPLLISHHELPSLNEINHFIKVESHHKFDLEKTYPIRINFLKQQNTNEEYLLVVVHHIAFDGWSMDIFIRDLREYYCYLKIQNNQRNLASSLENLVLPKLSIQYKDFAIWQRNYLTAERLEHQLAYWKMKLEGYENLYLPLDKKRPNEINYEGNDVFFQIEKNISEGLRATAKQQGVSLYSVLLAGFNLLLRSFSNQDDIIVGTPVANRHHSQLENLIGFFVNSLALRSQIDLQQTLDRYIETVGHDVIEAQLHQDLPFEKLVTELAIPKDPSRHPLFQVMFSVQSFGSEKIDSKDELFAPKNIEIYYRIAKFDLSVFIDDNQPELTGVFNYAESLFQRETIITLINTYQYILEHLAFKSFMLIRELSYLDTLSYQKIIIDWNQTFKTYPENKTIDQLFFEQVQKTPDQIALVYENKRLTYRELNFKANQLAHYLQHCYQLENDELVALCLDRNEHMLIAILAILKAGAAYVPMDPNHPDERIRYILQDTCVKVILVNEVYKNRLINIINHHQLSINLEVVESPSFQSKLNAYQESNPIHFSTHHNLAYVIYTSGTTGDPKGVMVEHKSLINTIASLKDVYALSNADRVSEFTSYIFDVSVAEIFVTLLNGAELHLLSENIRKDVNDLSEYLLLNKINVSYLPPILLSNLKKIDYPDLNRIIYAGEPCDAETGKYWSIKKLLFNYYGPTETSIYALGKQVIKGDVNLIGRPIANITVYVLDHYLNPLPIGAIGELYIGGIGLARGYLNLPDLTAERFITNPFQSQQDCLVRKNSRLYKTGDLVRYLANGNIEYIGRKDFQVKVRGFRIELGEIESILMNYPGVKQAAVIAKQHLATGTSNQYLIGYYVADKPLDETLILNHLREKLPDYEIPSVLVFLDKLPLTISGKLDRKALPDPEFTAASKYVAPRNELEHKLCELYAKVLGLSVKKVGIRDDFFRLGGDSIVCIQLVSRLRHKLGLTIGVKDIFECKTIEKLCIKILAQTVPENITAIEFKTENGLLSGNLGLLPVQKWFINQIKSNLYRCPGHWNQAFLIKTKNLDLILLKYSLVKLIEYHDSFRLNYRLTENGDYEQYYSESITYETLDLKYLNIAVLNNHQYQEILTHWQNHFNLLNNTPLYQIGYLEGCADGSSRIFFALHHLLVDAVSWRIITHDLKELYSKLNLAKQNNCLDKILQQDAEQLLGKKGTSYRQWVEHIQAYSAAHIDEFYVWEEMVKDLKVTEQPLKALIKNEQNHSRAEFRLNQKQTRQLLIDSGHAYHTEINDLLLAGFGRALAQLTHQEKHYITLEGHGREEMIPSIDITRTVGWFTTMYPVRLKIDLESITDSIKQVKENRIKIPHKGIGYGALVGYVDQALPCISFNYLGQFDPQSGNEDWSITGEACGHTTSTMNIDNQIINANGAVFNDELRFYITGKMSQAKLDKLATLFKDQLLAIVDHIKNLPSVPITSLLTITEELIPKWSKNAEIDNEPLLSLHANYWNQMIEKINNNYFIEKLKNNHKNNARKYREINTKIINNNIEAILNYLNSFILGDIEEAFFLNCLCLALSRTFEIEDIPVVIKRIIQNENKSLDEINLNNIIKTQVNFLPLLISTNSKNIYNSYLDTISLIKSTPDIGLSYLICKYIKKNININLDDAIISFQHLNTIQYANDNYLISAIEPEINFLSSLAQIETKREGNELHIAIKYADNIFNDSAISTIIKNLNLLIDEYNNLFARSDALNYSIPCHPSQLRFLLHNKDHYNIYCIINLYEFKKNINLQKFKLAVAKAINASAIPVQFNYNTEKKNQWIMCNPQYNKLDLRLIDDYFKNNEASDYNEVLNIVREKAREILIKNKCFNVGFINDKYNRNYFYAIMHHLVFDRSSEIIFLSSIEKYYHNPLGYDEMRFEIDHSYIQFCYELFFRRNSFDLSVQRKFWESLLKDTDFVSDKRRISTKANRGDMRDLPAIMLSRNSLGQFKHDEYSVFHITLYAFYYTLKQFYHLKKPSISIILNGNICDFNNNYISLNNTIGWKAITIPFACLLNDSDHETNIINISRVITSLSWNGHGYGVLKYLSDHKLDIHDTDFEFNFQSHGIQQNESNHILQNICSTFEYDGHDQPEFQCYLYVAHSNNQLAVNAHYSSLFFTKKEMLMFLHSMKKNIRNIFDSIIKNEDDGPA